jgi:hypothetical protein
MSSTLLWWNPPHKQTGGRIYCSPHFQRVRCIVRQRIVVAGVCAKKLLYCYWRQKAGRGQEGARDKIFPRVCSQGLISFSYAPPPEISRSFLNSAIRQGPSVYHTSLRGTFHIPTIKVNRRNYKWGAEQSSPWKTQNFKKSTVKSFPFREWQSKQQTKIYGIWEKKTNTETRKSNTWLWVPEEESQSKGTE